jgi:predicted ATPase
LRVVNIRINKWRHFENVDFQIDQASNLVCIVGANGTGKSHLLELIASCASKLGLSIGVEIPRGDAFTDPHDFYLQLYIGQEVDSVINNVLASNNSFKNWDRTLSLYSVNENNNLNSYVRAGGIQDINESVSFANSVVNLLHTAEDVYFLSLDANRAYPKKNLQTTDLARAYETNWSNPRHKRDRSYRITSTLYDEWSKYFLAQENQNATKYINEVRRARETGRDEPVFIDHFDKYRQSVQQILPYLAFTGVDSQRKTLLFDVAGLSLSFDELSGGEKEIAFLVGQIDRFRLQEGLFLLDEPELHLNSDLIRSWVTYLVSTARTGQIWLATHSLEAVEVAGTQSTFVLEKNLETRKVTNVTRLNSRPFFSALARAVGTPAFSIAQMAFVFVEGEGLVGERERFRKLAGSPQNIRFIEGGACTSVLNRVESIRSFANETEPLRVGGIIDKDFRSREEVSRLNSTLNVFVLPVHEVENFFLHPDTLQNLLKQNGDNRTLPLDLIRSKSDLRAGSWIFQCAMAHSNSNSLPKISPHVKDHIKRLKWNDFLKDQEKVIESIVKIIDHNLSDRDKLISSLKISIDMYARKRDEIDLWKVCEGKQVLGEVAREIGFNNPATMEKAAIVVWEENHSKVPHELLLLREYLAGL